MLHSYLTFCPLGSVPFVQLLMGRETFEFIQVREYRKPFVELVCVLEVRPVCLIASIKHILETVIVLALFMWFFGSLSFTRTSCKIMDFAAVFSPRWQILLGVKLQLFFLLQLFSSHLYSCYFAGDGCSSSSNTSSLCPLLYYFFITVGLRLCLCGTVVTDRPTVHYQTLHEWVWGNSEKIYWQGKIEGPVKKPVSLPFCLPEIPHRLPWEWTWESTVSRRWLMAWAMALLSLSSE